MFLPHGGGGGGASSRRNVPLPADIKQDDSDEDLFTVPDVESGPGSAVAAADQLQQSGSSGYGDAPPKQRRGWNPVDRENRQLKRLLRNRVSAQQARERKKVYVNELESRANELHDQNSKLEERISTLVNENAMLRKVLMNTRPKVDDNGEPQNDQADNS